VIAAVSVFLLFNMRSPWRARARVFMGNAGSAFLGYLIAWVCFRLTQNPGHPVTPVLAPFFVAPLIIDCLVLIFRRLREGRSPFAAGRDHMHHFMLDAGLTPTQIAISLSLVSAALGLGAALALRSNRVPDGILLLVFMLLTAGYYWLSSDRARIVAVFGVLQRALAFTRRRPDRQGTAGARRHEDGTMDEQSQDRIAVIGLGYVGLPLAVEFARKYDTVGFDIAAGRIEELRAGRDSTLEVEPERLAASPRLRFSASVEDIAGCNVFIVTVPTPIDAAKRPDLGPLVRASQSVGGVLKRGDLVVYESTVYPGCTEEVCVPLLEKHSGLRFNRDFFVGYSPERINPGDKEHRLTTIRKVTSGSTPEAAARVDALYASIIDAGTHRASSVRVAEAAKVIENTQRDLNIALVNELAVLFGKLGIDTVEVLEAAGTKWNFLPFRPGLVGGHCISVDPYYLTHKAQEIGHHADVILAGRRINDSMGEHVASEVIRLMARHRLNPVGARILVLGLAFKENCPDLRNTRVIDIVSVLRQYHAEVDVFDPWVDAGEAEHEYGLRPIAAPEAGRYDAAIVAVAHRQFLELGSEGIRALLRPGGVLYDVKAALPRAGVDGRL
jgi:UDP-N-acetyl-D-galactosamine dehydrogenase